MAKLVIYGAGGAAKLAHYYFIHDSKHEVVAFTVDKQYLTDDSFFGLPLFDFAEVIKRYPPKSYKIFIGVGYLRMNKARAEKYYQVKKLGYELVSYISSKCSVLTDNPIGENCFITENTAVQPFVKIGNNVVIRNGCDIGHDTVIEDHCFIASQVTIPGRVHIYPYCFIGANATLRNDITIARETLIGAGAVVMQDTIEKGVYVPPKAQLLSKKSDEIKL